MKLVASVALLLAGASLVACGSSAVNQRAAIVRVIRTHAVKAGDTHLNLYDVRISKLDPHYAIAQEQYRRPDGMIRAHTWILRQTGASWRATYVGNLFPTCSAAPAKVRRELIGAACYPPIGVYTSIPWTRGRSVRLRYCERPGGPSNFVAASQGVTCNTAAFVVRAIEHRCTARGSCEVGSFRCRSYWNGRYGQRFGNVHHALCTNGRRRIEWDGG